MDEGLRYLQRQYNYGNIDIVEWMAALRRANQPFDDLLVAAWNELLSISSTTLLPVGVEYQQMLNLHKLLQTFPLRCTCQVCFIVSSTWMCTCCVTGTVTQTQALTREFLQERAMPCVQCQQNGCHADFGDSLWVKPGSLALAIEEPRTEGKISRAAYPYCRGYHYVPRSSGEEAHEIDHCYQGTSLQKLMFMVRHAKCRYEPDVGERDDELENWRDMLTDLGPGEFPPY